MKPSRPTEQVAESIDTRLAALRDEVSRLEGARTALTGTTKRQVGGNRPGYSANGVKLGRPRRVKP